jgi:MAPEG family.
MNEAGNRNDPQDLRAQRKTLMRGMPIAAPVALFAWLALRYGLSPLPDMQAWPDRLWFAIGCCCVAVLLCLLLGIEAVSHERLVTAAINPLAGAESTRMKVNLRYLQNTLEQLLLFIPGLLGLAHYCDNGASMRAVVATTVVWILARFVFWIGYHQGPLFRAPGLVGVAQSLLVLLYVCARFADDVAGIIGAVVVIGLFAFGEIYLVWINRKSRIAQE